jgi:non-haem dioxygenase in morphine synthesis N-terminal
MPMTDWGADHKLSLRFLPQDCNLGELAYILYTLVSFFIHSDLVTAQLSLRQKMVADIAKTDDFPIANLETVDVKLLEAKDSKEYDRLLKACKHYGFFYLQLSDYGTVLSDWQKLLQIMGEYFEQPLDVKMKDSRNSDTHG